MKKLVLLAFILILIYTRFVNIGWGLPYPMHPDERNMANAVQQLSCPSFISLITNHQPLTTCFNPHFFAYGQLPLYIAYGGIQIYHLVLGLTGQPTYEEAVIALRVISALSSILLVFVLLKIIKLIILKSNIKNPSFSSAILIFAFLFLIFQPYAIQLAHFGTTESLLMLLYALIIHQSLKLLTTNLQSPITIVLLALFSGLALGTKMSSLLFLGVPIMVIFLKVVGGTSKGTPTARTNRLPAGLGGFGAPMGNSTSDRIYHVIITLFFYSLITVFFFLISSPHNILNWNDFISSMTYESRVGLGRFVAFYTRQFVDTTPIIFQMTKILPYTLGWPTFIGGILGFFLLPSFVWQHFLAIFYISRLKRTQKCTTNCLAISIRHVWSVFGERQIVTESAAMIDILRFSLLLSFLPSSFFFAKWTRFISPSFPLFSLFAILFYMEVFQKMKRFTFHSVRYIVLLVILIIPGIAYLSIYTSPDVRFMASKNIYKNMQNGSKILSETANAIDLPITSPTSNKKIPSKNFLINSFNFYDLDQDLNLQNNLNKALQQADYIVIPSRRIFYNHTCFISTISQINKQQTEKCKKLEKIYPLLNAYYQDLFSGKLGFKQVAQFDSFPKISIMGKTLLEFPDEDAEETWTVFDHPVIRIFKKNPQLKAKSSKLKTKNNLDFSDYKKTTFDLSAFSFQLLVADTPEKWEKGLMYVKNKEDINGLDGMIFTFPDSQSRSFWNKNTLSHLTLYWIQNNAVLSSSDLPSISETGVITTVSSPASADTVIEIIK